DCTLVSLPVPRLITLPSTPPAAAAAMRPLTVSETYMKSRVVEVVPSTTWGRVSACVTIVGITARADCRGPNVLNGRATTIGTPNAQWNASASLSAPILHAEYGD